MDFTWNDSYSVGNDTIDQQHQKLLSLFDKTYHSLQGKTSYIDLLEIVSDLLVYSIFHFEEEELMMAKSNYDQLEAHKKEHKQFIAQVHSFKDRLSSNPEALNEDIFLFLAEWILNHIKATDQGYKGLL